MKLIESKTIETERLILRSSKMEEQKRLWEILMIPEVNKWYLTGAVKDNIGSCRIFEKLGFEKIGEIEEESPYTFYDGILTFSKYGLTKEYYFNNENNRVRR